MNVIATKNYSVKQAAEILGKTRQTINRYCQTKNLRYSISRANGRKIIKGSDIIKAMQTL